MLKVAWKRFRLNDIQAGMPINNNNKKKQKKKTYRKSIKHNGNTMLILFDNGKLIEINMELCLFISA